MGKERGAQLSTLQEFFQAGVYKRNQGRVARQLTFASLAVIVALGAWSLSNSLAASEPFYRYGIPGLLLAAGMWISYRVVNLPKFADFLIAVEGEMAKVSWPSRAELVRSSIVVIVTIFFLAAILFAYDLIWKELLRALKVLN